MSDLEKNSQTPEQHTDSFAPLESLPAQLPTQKESVTFSARDWLAVAMALCLSLLWFRVFGLQWLLSSGSFPWLGVTIFTLLLFAAVFTYLGKRVVLNRSSIFLTAVTVLLSFSFALYRCESLWLFNICLLFFMMSMTVFSLSGKTGHTWKQTSVLWSTLKLSFVSLFAHFLTPLRALGGLFQGDKKKLLGILIGILCAVPLLVLVIHLLSSADAVFANVFHSLLSFFERADAGTLFWRTAKTILVALLIFSFLYFLPRPGKSVEKNVQKERKAPASAPFLTVLALLDAVYVLFVGIQLAFLFGGAQTAAMEGGWAEYARNGFFQLVAVAAINLCAVLLTAACLKDAMGKALKALSFLLVGLTAVILASAAWRMRLYILAYGLSLLRAMTLFAMAFILICLIAAARKVQKPSFSFWPVFFAVGIVGWLAFNYCNIGGQIANYNVNAYLSGQLPQVDIYYLSHLSPGALPALEKLRDTVGGNYTGNDAAYSLDEAIDHCVGGRQGDIWRQWSLDAFLAAKSR